MLDRHADFAYVGAVNSDVAQEATLSKLLGVEIGGYRITRLLGKGGMGAVFEAAHKTLNLRTAIKVMLPNDQAGATATDVQRFLDEARALSEVQHSSLVKLHDVGTLADGTIYMQMELLGGESIATRIRRPDAQSSLRAMLELGRQMASALEVVHERGIVHRDLKPSNILVVPDREAAGGERAKILDFGIAKFQDSAQPRTAQGQVLGTPRYMSPEQCESLPQIDDRTDVYSLALVLFEMLTGVSPYQVSDEQQLAWLYAHIEKRPRLLCELRPDAPAALEALLARMLDKMPESRPAMAEVAQRLASCAAESGELKREERAPSREAEVKPPVATSPIERTGTLDKAGHELAPRPQSPRSGLVRRLRWMLPIAALLILLALLGLRPWFDRSKDPSSADRRAAAQTPSGMVLIWGRTFSMGSTLVQVGSDFVECAQFAKDCDRTDFERELVAHPVTVSSYFIDKYEVTNQQYAAFLNLPLLQAVVEGGRKVYSRQHELILDLYPQHSGIEYVDKKFVARAGFEQRPVIQVTWLGARKYCESQGHSLPTEAQWELAARGLGLGKDRDEAETHWPWGDEPPRCADVVVAREKGGACEALPPGSQPVGTSKQDVTPHGVHDLGGNAREWVLDRFVAPYAECGPCRDPVQLNLPSGESGPGFRVVRGGNWIQNPSRARAASRALYHEGAVATSIGFRCAATAVR